MLVRRPPLEVIRLFRPHDGTLAGLLQSRAQADPTAPFLVFRGRTWSRSEFFERSQRLAGGLARRGIGEGSKVAVICTNHEAQVLLLFALASLNAAMVPINPAATATDIRYILDKAGADAVALTAQTLAPVREALDGARSQPWLIDVEGAGEGAIPFESLCESEPPAPLPPPNAQATCLVIFTSGTTGLPKGVMHSQSNFVLAGEANVSRLWLQPEDRVLTILPLFHTNALFYSVAGAAAAGACLLLVEKFSASNFWQLAVETGATTVNIIEAVGRILKARPREEFRPEHRIESLYGARIDVADCFRDEFHIPNLISGFGMTEIPGVFCVPWNGLRKIGSMGLLGAHPDPDVEWAQARLVDDNGADVLGEGSGELWVKHPIVMQGYLNDPEQTHDAFADGWFKTGDLVRRDADGVYWFVTRKKDIIRRRGENISGAEIDRLVSAMPGVVEAAAIPVPSELGEDEVMVCVLRRDDASITEADVRAWCAARLTAIKVPRFVLLVDSLPYTPTHKVAKQVLKAQATQLRERARDFLDA